MKKSLMSSMRLLAVVSSSLLLGACATSSGVSFGQYRGMDEAAKSSFKDTSDAEVADKIGFDRIQEKRLYAGLPVTFEVDSIKLTKIWDPSTRRLSFYEGYVTSTFGSDSLLLLSVITEETSPKPWLQLNKATGKWEYSTIAANVSVQETMARALAKAVLSWGGSALNGWVAAEVNKSGACGSDCGNTTLINAGGNSSSASKAESVSASAVDASIQAGCLKDGACW